MSQAAGRIRFTAPSPQPLTGLIIFADHDFRPGRLRICAGQSTKASFKTGGQGQGRTANLPLFKESNIRHLVSGRSDCSRRTSSSLLYRLGRVRRVKAKPHAVAARALTRRLRLEGWQPSRRTGRSRTRSPAWADHGHGSPGHWRAINVGNERSLTVICGHSAPQVRPCDRLGLQIPELIVRVRFPSPTPREKGPGQNDGCEPGPRWSGRFRHPCHWPAISLMGTGAPTWPSLSSSPWSQSGWTCESIASVIL